MARETTANGSITIIRSDAAPLALLPAGCRRLHDRPLRFLTIAAINKSADRRPPGSPAAVKKVLPVAATDAD